MAGSQLQQREEIIWVPANRAFEMLEQMTGPIF